MYNNLMTIVKPSDYELLKRTAFWLAFDTLEGVENMMTEDGLVLHFMCEMVEGVFLQDVVAI